MKQATAYFELSLARIIVGSSVVVGKLAIANFPVFLASEIRFIISCLILVPLLFKFEGGIKGLTKKEWLLLFLQALTGTFLFNVLLLYGLKFTSAAEGGIITSTTPAVVGVISFLFLKERLSTKKGLGIVLTVFGILALNVLGNALQMERGPLPLLGNLLIFGAILGESLFIIFQKILSKTVSPLATATVVSGWGLLMFLPFSIYEANRFNFLSTTPIDWLAVVYLAIFLTVIAFLLWFHGVTHVPASTAAVFTGFMPISGVLLSYLVLREPFSWVHILGVLCVLLGIGFVTRPGQKTV
ncbi:MAG: DMT family transporter [Chloroflexota bacterium]